MREYGWDYDQYMRNPTWITEAAHRKMEIERKIAKEKQDEIAGGH